ncbi:MAG: hypothetical protein HY926_02565 [Elusimicrobia bacterium]|nr:hypothetical protein [Elusimicrobiota bacterium]
MDVLLRLRVLIWVVLLSLWGVMVYQYLGEEEEERMRKVVSPYTTPLPSRPQPGSPEFAGAAAPEQLPPDARQEPAWDQTQPPAPAPAAEDSSLAMVQPPGTEAYPLPGVRAPDFVRGPAHTGPAGESPPAQEGRRAPPPKGAEREVPVPPGFVKRFTRHFTIYSEGDPPSTAFLQLLEDLHGNLMLDLSPFSPWAKDDRVMVFLFKNQDTYRDMTGRPAWSGGASSVPKRKVYLYESSELPGILAHELCHIYYDSFFSEGATDPLWLSEGMATLIQIERGQARPVWLRENLEILERGGGFSLEALMDVSTTKGMGDARVRLWYAQSYSLVRFLIRTQYKSSFFKFSRYLREGRPMAESLYRAYGMPYNRVKALEYAWRYELTTNRLSHLMASSPQP